MMNAELEQAIDTIIEGSQALLSERDGTLDSKQKRFVHIILANAERFIHLAAEFTALPPEEVTQELRHEIGNPLTPIHGYAELMRMSMAESLNEAQREWIKQIHQATGDLREIVDGMVQEARAAAGQHI